MTAQANTVSNVETSKPKVKKGQKGAGAVEYALVLGVITAMLVGLATSQKENFDTFFESVSTTIQAFIGGGGGGK